MIGSFPRLLLFVLLGLAGWLPGRAAGEPIRTFDVPAAAADKSLPLLARQAGIQMLFDPEVVAGSRTRAVKGRYPVEVALARLLAGTPLRFVKDSATGAYAVGKIAENPVTEKKVPSVLPGAPMQTSNLTTPDPTSDSAPRARRVPRLLAGLAALVAGGLHAQPAPAAAPAEEIVLSPFEVSTSASGDRYAPAEATSGGRVRTKLFDSPSTISVISRELIDDVGAMRVLDAAKYSAGVTENIIPNGLDFITVRGFTTREQMVDGFQSQSQVNIDPAILDRMEIAKGPNSVLSPAGVPGGTINLVTKKPRFRDAGSISAEVARFEGSRVEADVERLLTADTSLRVVAAGQDAETYVDSYQQNWLLMPMVAHRFSPDTQITLQFIARDARMQNYMGLPIDPTSGPIGDAELVRGVDRFLNIYGDNYRWERRYNGRFFFTSNLSDNFSMRLAASFITLDYAAQQNQPSYPLWGAINPRTGLFTPGITYGPAPTFTPSPVTTPPPRIMNRGGRLSVNETRHIDIQNDYVHTFSPGPFVLTSQAGYAFAHLDQRGYNIAQTKPAVNFDDPASAVVNIVATDLPRNFDAYFYTDRHQLYLTESLSTLSDRLIVNAGVSHTDYSLQAWNYLNNTAPRNDTATTNKSFGLLVKPVKNVAVFYSYSDASAALGALNVVAGGPTLQAGEQHEGGVRVTVLNEKVKFSAVYFDIAQSNNAVTDPRNTAFPPPSPLFPNLLSDRVAKGWEFEVAGSLTENFSIIGNYTTFTNRNLFDVAYGNAAETSWALFGRYDFTKQSRLSGLAIGLGANYVARRPGDNGSGLAAGSTPTQLVPNQPTFYLPARTLVDLNLSYKFSRQWSAQVNVENLLDEEYLVSSESRSSVWAGVPLNARLKVTFTF